MILGADCNKVKFNEMAVAEAQIAKVRNTIGAEKSDVYYSGRKNYAKAVLMSRDYK